MGRRGTHEILGNLTQAGIIRWHPITFIKLTDGLEYAVSEVHLRHRGVRVVLIGRLCQTG